MVLGPIQKKYFISIFKETENSHLKCEIWKNPRSRKQLNISVYTGMK